MPEKHSTDQLDCQACGACCIHSGNVSIALEDHAELDKIPSDLIDFQFETSDSMTRMRRHIGGRCVALDGVIGATVSCRIYDNRPSVCRSFPPGCESCLDARETMRYKLSHMSSRPRGYGEDWQETV